MKRLDLKSGRALVVVAHPDDETIWMGGTITRFKNVHWTIVSLCRKSDADRAPKFGRVCAHYGAKAVIHDLEDEGIMGVKESVPEITKILSRELAGKRFAYLFTHAKNGEYGHPRHKSVHRAVAELLRERKLAAERVLFFAYRLDRAGKVANDLKTARFTTQLGREELSAKRNVVKNLYGFSHRSFENASCLPVETFAPAFDRGHQP